MGEDILLESDNLPYLLEWNAFDDQRPPNEDEYHCLEYACVSGEFLSKLPSSLIRRRALHRSFITLCFYDTSVIKRVCVKVYVLFSGAVRGQ